VTADALKNAYLGIKPDQYSLLNLIEYHNTHPKDTIEWGTMKNYMTTQNYVKEFLKNHAKTSDMLLAHLSCKFLVDFEFYLRAYKPVDHHSQMGNNTVMKHPERKQISRLVFHCCQMPSTSLRSTEIIQGRLPQELCSQISQTKNLMRI
jgi:hypothetical protein